MIDWACGVDCSISAVARRVSLSCASRSTVSCRILETTTPVNVRPSLVSNQVRAELLGDRLGWLGDALENLLAGELLADGAQIRAPRGRLRR